MLKVQHNPSKVREKELQATEPEFQCRIACIAYHLIDSCKSSTKIWEIPAHIYSDVQVCSAHVFTGGGMLED